MLVNVDVAWALPAIVQERMRHIVGCIVEDL